MILIVVVVGAFIILRPRLWVKNKTAEITVDGRLSEDVKLFHGSDDRLLFYLKEDPQGAYVYDSHFGLWRCTTSYFANFKIIAFSVHHSSGCADSENGDVMTSVKLETQSLAFQYHDEHIIVSWQPAPR